MTYYPSLRQEKMRVASLVRNSLLLSGIIQVIDDLLPIIIESPFYDDRESAPGFQ